MQTTKPPIPTQEQPLDKVRACMPQLMREWLKSAAIVDIPLMQSAVYMEVQLRAQKLGLTPMVRYEIDELATAKFAKAVLDMQLDEADLVRSRPQLLQAALRSARGSLTLRATGLIPTLGKGKVFEAHKTDALRDRNFANFDDAFAWLDRAETTSELAKREQQLAACQNTSFLACA